MSGLPDCSADNVQRKRASVAYSRPASARTQPDSWIGGDEAGRPLY